MVSSPKGWRLLYPSPPPFEGVPRYQLLFLPGGKKEREREGSLLEKKGEVRLSLSLSPTMKKKER